MSINVLGDILNFTENETVLSKNFIMDVGKNITFENGTELVAKKIVYFPDDTSRIFIGGTTITLKKTLEDGIPKGCIMIWSGIETSIPSGWKPCYGGSDNGVSIPDLRGLFVIGTNPSNDAINTAYPLNNVRGNVNNRVTLTTSNFPNHTHTGNTSASGQNHSHQFILGNGTAPNGRLAPTRRDRDQVTRETLPGNSSHIHTLTTNNAGSGTSLNILPPYYALIYIIKTS